jgi:L-fuculose-phosphate aldolase
MVAPRSDAEAFDAARRQLVEYGRRLGTDGLVLGSAGNLSVRVGDVVVITPSSMSYENVEQDDLCVVAPDGTKIEGRGSISSEWPMHWAVYSASSAGAVVHTHSPEVIALSATCDVLPAIHYAIARVGGPVRVVPYTRFGSEGLAQAASAALEGRSAAILQNHGAIAYGSTLAEAYDRAVLLEWLAGIYRKALQYGSPRILTEPELDEVVAEVRRRRYGEATTAVASGGR